MNPKNGPRHVVVDGSNIATEGRSLPSLAQLSEAVASFMEEHPDATITVVVDATFGHRIDKRETAEFEAGISNNELVAPPAGAIGRGDAFVLSIAQKAGASILSNDSFQEFHADYEWLFDEGRLIGGKPVPHVGWVFVNRSPVRGPVSRKAIQGAKLRGGTKRGARRVPAGSGSPLANEPMPVPKSPPPRRAGSDVELSSVAADGAAPKPNVAPASAPRAGEVVNELMPFLEFVEHHPIGTSVNGIVDAYSSHGAYISIGSDGVRGYIPLRLMSDPPPPSARKVMQIGEAVTVVVVSFAAARRSIDCAMPDMAQHAPVDTDPLVADPVEQPRSGRRGRGRKAAPDSDAATPPIEQEQVVAPVPEFADLRSSVTADEPAPAASKPSSRKAAAKKVGAKKAAAASVPGEQAAAKAPAKKASARKAAPAEAPAKKAAATKAPAKKAAAAKSPATKASARRTATNAPATNAPAVDAPVEQAAAAQTSQQQTSPEQTTTEPTRTVKAPATKKATARSTPAKKTPAKQAPGRKAAAKKAPAQKSPAQKSPARKAAPRKSSPSKATAGSMSPAADPEGVA